MNPITLLNFIHTIPRVRAIIIFGKSVHIAVLQQTQTVCINHPRNGWFCVVQCGLHVGVAHASTTSGRIDGMCLVWAREKLSLRRVQMYIPETCACVVNWMKNVRARARPFVCPMCGGLRASGKSIHIYTWVYAKMMYHTHTHTRVSLKFRGTPEPSQNNARYMDCWEWTEPRTLGDLLHSIYVRNS